MKTEPCAGLEFKHCDYDTFLVVCPYGCTDTSKVQYQEATTTLVGWSGGPEDDPNHHHQTGRCLACGRAFIKHWVRRDKSTWYTADNRQDHNHLLLGWPTCCERIYTYRCKCGGAVQHNNMLVAPGAYPGTISFVTVDGRSIPAQPMYYLCKQCGQRYPDFQYGTEFMGPPPEG
jgi:hypothetical protein